MMEPLCTFHNQPGVTGHSAGHSWIDAFIQLHAVSHYQPVDEFVVWHGYAVLVAFLKDSAFAHPSDSRQGLCQNTFKEGILSLLGFYLLYFNNKIHPGNWNSMETVGEIVYNNRLQEEHEVMTGWPVLVFSPYFYILLTIDHQLLHPAESILFQLALCPYVLLASPQVRDCVFLLHLHPWALYHPVVDHQTWHMFTWSWSCWL